MIKKLILLLVLVFICYARAPSVDAVDPILNANITPVPCNFNEAASCPTDLVERVYPNIPPKPPFGQEMCATSYDDFKTDPTTKHYWVEDPDITAQAKADERAREFINWVFYHNGINNQPVLRQIWFTSTTIALFFVLLMGAIMGIGYIIGQRSNFQINIKIWPSVTKIGLALVYIVFSYAIIITFLQVTDGIMKFFIERLGAKDLFNIYFSNMPGEANYNSVIGCRDLNIRVQEGVQAELFMLKATNVTYYVMGTMLLLRQIILWFMLFVSPFLALLMPFVFIRNIGWIWIGVFFQWLFYGPLFALFIGALATIWKAGIPFAFNFTGRVNEFAGYIYPTALNIVYGGPAQHDARQISVLNNGNYVDTFTEYVITLIMLWAVIFFPWWLLRIFRDYCCEGINAMKNILLSMYDKSRIGPHPSTPTPSPIPVPSFLKTSVNVPKQTEIPVKVKLETVEEIRKTRTEDISRSLNLSVSKLSDIARLETEKTSRSEVIRHLDYLSNPLKAETPAQRQQYMNLRTELFNRAIKEDKVAQKILSATSNSAVEKIQRREEFLQSAKVTTPITHVVAVKVKLPQDKVFSINNSLVNAITASSQVLSTIAQNAQITVQQVQQILASYKEHVNGVVPAAQSFTASQAAAAIPSKYIEREKVTEGATNTTNTTNRETTAERQTTTEQSQMLSTKEWEKLSEKEKLARFVKMSSTEREKLPASEREKLTERERVTKASEKATLSEKETATQTVKGIPVSRIIQTGKILETISRETGVKQETVVKVLKQVAKVVKQDKTLAREIAEKENIKPEQLEQVVESQVPAVAEPEKHIEETISIPPTVSLDDYEEVKHMWTQQYEQGEVPISDSIPTRQDWLEQDIVAITNTINKLLSPNDELRQQGLDELGYILPIFLINNLSGEEILVYLKAKLEAAKEVMEKLFGKKEVEEKKEEKEEELVEVAPPKKEEAEKTMTMEESREIPKENKAGKKDTNNTPLNTDELEIKGRLDELSRDKT